MEKKPKTFKLPLDFWLIAIAIGFSTALAVLLTGYEKWLLEPRIRDQEPRTKVAETSDSTNKPKRRYAGSLTYFNLLKGESINVGDTLFVDANSTLELKLSTGSTIRLGAMTLVLVDRENNQIKLILNNGEVDGQLKENDKIKFDVNEEPVELTGDEGATFKVSKKDLFETSASSQKGKISMRFRGENLDLTKKKINLNQPQFEKPPVADLPNSKPQETREPTAAKNAIQEQQVSLDDLPIDLPIPYPPNKQLFLVKKSASLIVMPKRLCKKLCTMTLLHDQKPSGTWTFQENSAPLVKFEITPHDKGHYTMQLNDDQEQKSEFDIDQFSSGAFENAVKAGLSVEILD